MNLYTSPPSWRLAAVGLFFLIVFGVSGALIAVLAVLMGMVLLRVEYVRSVLEAMDRTCAAVIGWGGKYTISAECGSRRTGCAFCRFACWLMNKIENNHCAEQARREGL